jgi:hypothetical protein
VVTAQPGSGHRRIPALTFRSGIAALRAFSRYNPITMTDAVAAKIAISINPMLIPIHFKRAMRARQAR